MGKIMSKAPRIFHVNWFRTGADGKILWPGYRENLRVLEWILDRCNGTVGCQKTPIGYLPRPKDIDMTKLNLAEGAIKKLLAVNRKDWLEELKGIKEFFKTFGDDLPEELWQEYYALHKRLTGGKAGTGK
jgi:phosphoenolpyruvate carboxykinase (GTP)